VVAVSRGVSKGRCGRGVKTLTAPELAASLEREKNLNSQRRSKRGGRETGFRFTWEWRSLSLFNIGKRKKYRKKTRPYLGHPSTRKRKKSC